MWQQWWPTLFEKLLAPSEFFHFYGPANEMDWRMHLHYIMIIKYLAFYFFKICLSDFEFDIGFWEFKKYKNINIVHYARPTRYLAYCVCVKGITLCNCLCSSSPSSSSRHFTSVIRNIEKFGAKTILQTKEQLIQFTVLKIWFRSLKYMAVISIRKNLKNIPFLSKR